MTDDEGTLSAWNREIEQLHRRYHFTDEDLPFGADVLTYRLRQVDTDGTAHLSSEQVVRRRAPSTIQFNAPFPNPVRQQATLQYSVPEATPVKIAICDVLGRRVTTVLHGRVEAGRHETQVPVGQLAPGTYLVRFEAGDSSQTRRLTVMR